MLQTHGYLAGKAVVRAVLVNLSSRPKAGGWTKCLIMIGNKRPLVTETRFFSQWQVCSSSSGTLGIPKARCLGLPSKPYHVIKMFISTSSVETFLGCIQ